ncbi:Long-chain-fatty-acid--CoA ligase FadD19 [Sterolibacterium denitrificans]|uniref:Long-chain-fatty-acid--CoA ligase FadD19 n=1 Tax=Sterolibacterium denitrificans TaxID=157592 RepID=A0A7Z7HR48_9PROT|nr:acyl-CoA synthetase [Sterolibacterium denitrificans]SMB25033.1 Long-chain-fatty-acid--CoA ligase FadD19 [Sterolibacterium denitrificans]
MSKAKTFNLADLFSVVVEAVPEREAIVCGTRRLTYRQLDDRATGLARWLRAKGIQAGDTVGIHAYNCNEFVEACFAAFKLKAIPVNVNYRYTSEELRYLYDNAELKALIYEAELETQNLGALSAAPGLRAIARLNGSGQPGIKDAVDYEQAITAVSAANASLDDIPLSDDDQMLLYTGGTTGMPKGVIWPHKALFYAGFGGGGGFSPSGPIKAPHELVDRINEGMQIRLMPTAPLMHGAGLWATLIGLYGGNTVYLDPLPGFDAERALDTAATEQVNVMTIVGDAMGIPLVDALKANPGRWDLSSLMAISSASALFSEHIQQAMRELISPYIRLVNSMGSSETGQAGVSLEAPKEGLIQLTRNETCDVAVLDGPVQRFAQPGERGILVRMGYLPVGYFKDPVKTAATFATIEGKRCSISGDIARLNEDGTITVFGRDSQCINTGGEKVFTEEVEQAIRSHPDVIDAVVVGVADERWGQRVVGVVALREGGARDGEAIRAHVRQHLAGYKVPKDIVFVDAVKRTPVGKADYVWAKDTAQQTLKQ